MKAGWAYIMVALTACSSSANETVAAPDEPPMRTASATKSVAAPTPATKAALTLVPDGLSIVEAPTGKARLIPFGTSRGSAELTVGRAQGAQERTGTSFECGAGTIDFTSYKGDLQLTFHDDKFVGWTINSGDSPLKTAKGIGVGSPRQSLDAAYKDVTVEDSSLGLLFNAGGLVGILDQDGIEGIVTDIWAGTVCLID